MSSISFFLTFFSVTHVPGTPIKTHVPGTTIGTPVQQTIIATPVEGTSTPANLVFRGSTPETPMQETSILQTSIAGMQDPKDQTILYSNALYEGNSFKCRRCSECFPTSMELAKHVQAHLKSYLCKMCKQRFFKKLSLNRHFKLFHRLIRETEIGQQITQGQLESESDSEPTPGSSHSNITLDGTKTTYIEVVKSIPKRRRYTKESDDSDYTPTTVHRSERHHKYHTRGKQTNFKVLAGYKDRKERCSSEVQEEYEESVPSEKGDVEVLVQGDEPGMITQAEADVIQALLTATEIDNGNTDKTETETEEPAANENKAPADRGGVQVGFAADRVALEEVVHVGAVQEEAAQEDAVGVESTNSEVQEIAAKSERQPTTGVAVIMDDDDKERTERLLNKGKLEDLIFKEKFEDGRYALYQTQSGIQAYKCGFCEVCCTKLESIKTHMEKHAEKKFCENCRRFFDTQEQLDKHLCRSKVKNLMPNSDGTFSCPDCGKLFKSRENLEPHYIGHTQNFSCDKCCRVFMRKETLEKHACLADAGTPKTIHHCDICGAIFKNMKYLFRHMTGHTKELVCFNCNKSFSRKQSLFQHLNKCNPSQLKDMDVEIHACTKCPKVFSGQVKLQNHMAWHDGKFRCQQCGKQFSTQMTLKGHVCMGKVVSCSEEEEEVEPNESTEKKFECVVCRKEFKKEANHDRHMVCHSDKFQCQMCKKAFGRKLDLEMHEIVCRGRISVQEKGFVKCTVCDNEFFNVNEFFKHSLEHTTPYKCGSCQRPYRSMHALEEHTKTCTGEWSDTTCKICGKVFRNIRYLERHKILHTKAKFQCEHCHKLFHRKDYYGYHTCKRADGMVVRVKHSHTGQQTLGDEEVQPHLCPTCGKSYVSVGNLNKHMKRHGEKQCQCPTCGKKFHLVASLKEHMRYVHTKKLDFQCPHCGKMLKSKNTVQAHIKYFHQENVMIYTCETCGKTFRQKGNLLKHQLMHIDGKTFQCPYCDRTFKYPEQLGKHKMEHEQGRKYVCAECEKTFVKEYDLKHHIEVFHSGLMYTCELCSTDCRHSHTIRRHIRRRHPEKVHLLEDPNYVKSLQRTIVNPDGTVRTHINTKSSKTVQQVVNVQDVTNVIETIAQTEEAVQSLQQIQSINIGGTEVQVIEEDPNNHDVAAIIDNVMSHEAAEVLQSLASNTQDAGVTVAAFTDIPNFAVDGTATHVIHHDAETQEYILVPLLQAESNIQVKTE
jgi:KRAB domain-containing zinc finger protein